MPASPRPITLRRFDRCVECQCDLQRGDIAVWDPHRRNVRCVECAPASSVPPPPVALQSTPGASARREYERRRHRREARVRERLGPLAGAALFLAGEPAHENAWAKGAAGEVKLAAKLERWTREAGVVLLHDRRVPAKRTNIDHIAIGPSGVFVIDAKRYKGRIAVERRGGLFTRRTEHLLVGRRDQSKLLDGIARQVAVVRNVLAAGPEVAVRGVLCFVDGDWPLVGTLEARGIPILPPRKTARLCSSAGTLDAKAMSAVATRLAEALVAA